ncbi:hypothetical protein SAMN03159343_0528 [Klenkia marina]|uniref:Tyr recombinase domain-containing protein n=1 Tax=Klenkia marina TaxID=1960309 RepID=A0A1G4XCD5_9ACTN|nr:hypothetical protein [Klenkia marina]SCX38879.1 hypothetical protein SAMN03159343_0528 [Klenkia marina]
MAEARFTRSGIAARKPTAARPAAPDGPARRLRSPRAQTADADPAATSPAESVDLVAARLQVALAALDPAMAGLIGRYRSAALDAEQWTQAADLFRLGMAVLSPTTTRAAYGISMALNTHSRARLAVGASRTISGWYGPDAIETTLAGGPIGTGAAAVTPPPSYASTFASRLRAIGRILVAETPAAPMKFTAHDPQAPLSGSELAQVLDFCDSHRSPRLGTRLGARLARLVWLGLGTGVRNSDLVQRADGGLMHLRGTDVTTTAQAVVVTTLGPDARRIPVLAAAEHAVAAAALEAGDGQFLDRLKRTTNVTDEVVQATGWDRDARFPITAGRLRQTWLAAVLAGGAPYPGIVRAAGITGERTLASLADRLTPLADDAYETALRCGTGPVPTAGQLALPGLTHPAPRLPFRDPR